MKKGYWVVAYKSISDESAVKAYAALAVPAVQSFGGRWPWNGLVPAAPPLNTGKFADDVLPMMLGPVAVDEETELRSGEGTGAQQ